MLTLYTFATQITDLDLSNNTALTTISCGLNPLLKTLNIQNGNNTNLTTFNALTNPLLSCIQVDDVAYMNTNWSAFKDGAATFSSTPCPPVVYIPDANFKAALVGNPSINTNADAWIQVSEASAYNGGINVDGLSISDLTGIEAFPLINLLSCQNNQLTSIDVSNNTALVFLYVSGNQISSLDVSANTVLENLRCGQNLLTSLDLSTITSVKYLYANDNQITSLNVANNAGLLNLECNQNDLTSLDVTNNPLLENLRVVANELTSIDISSNPLLQRINFQDNQFTELDLTSNEDLTEIYCQNNQLTSLNMQNGSNTGLLFFNATNNPSLQCIQVDDVAYMQTNWNAAVDPQASFSTDCSCIVYIPDSNLFLALINDNNINTNNNGLIECDEAGSYTGAINVSGLNITDLTGIEAFTSITSLNASNNQLTSIDVSANTALQSLQVENNLLTSLDISNNTALIILQSFNNPLTSLDVSANTALTEIFANNNQLTSIDVSNNTALTSLQLESNQLTALNVTANTAIQNLYITNNAINNIDVSGLNNLLYFYTGGNQLTSLDLSANPLLQLLYCENNQLSNLDLSANTALQYLRAMGNQFTSLDVSSNSALTSIQCSQNPLLTSLNVQNGNNSNLTVFDATQNPSLTCIQVDTVAYMNNNWSAGKDAGATYSIDCSPIVNIPDVTLKDRLVSNPSINTNADTEIQVSEAIAYTGEINVEDSNVADLTGVEAFINLTSINFAYTAVTTADLSTNTALTYINCTQANLTSINVNGLTSLHISTLAIIS